LAVSCVDHPIVRQMIERLSLRRDGRRLLTYGTRTDADIVLEDVRFNAGSTIFTAMLGQRVTGGARRLEGWRLPLSGQHNALNALAAIAVATEAGIKDEAIAHAIASFSGVKRRFQLTGTWNGVTIFDDYGHHPIEIEAVLRAARAGARGRVIAVVEPHRYTRVRDLFDDFCRCFDSADAVIVAPLYSAGEPAIDGIDHKMLAEGIVRAGHTGVIVIDGEREIAPTIRHIARSGDMVVCLGAGNSTDWAHALPQWLSEMPKRVGSAV
jgi:UDP-N-acetylmuramate--alanine ligase